MAIAITIAPDTSGTITQVTTESKADAGGKEEAEVFVRRGQGHFLNC